MNKNITHWFKLITITGSAQVIVQGLGFVCGILIIRLLPVEEYALYILANTMLGTMTVLADGGISQGVMAEGGKVWKDKDKLGIVLATGLDLRRKFAIGSLIIAIPILLYLLIDNGASLITSILIALSVIPAFYASLSDTLLQIVPKLHQNIKPLQRNQVEVSIVRLLILFLTLFIFPISIIAILANGFPRIYGNIKLRKITKEHSNIASEPSPEVRKNILKVVKRIMPGSIYYAISGQLIIWLVSIFGNTTNIAQIGALGRFSMLFALIQTICHFLIIPKFSIFNSTSKNLRLHFFKFQLLLIVLFSLIVMISYFFSDYMLWILGDKYFGLNYELLLVLISSAIVTISGINFNIGASKGWPSNSIILILGNIIFIIIGLLTFDVSNFINLLKFNIFIGLFPLIFHTTNFIYMTFQNKNFKQTS
ncbi:polysaccharide biosynthesis protein [Algibacter sp. TI.3.09]|uniref:lipopolysaccharide biosynthesis protein n=1 Tax=Algibacter sp. TI.3.09 TaxID=3121298 RepID=UPI00311F297C